jgi:putative tricarboxylic transport membrane protein
VNSPAWRPERAIEIIAGTPSGGGLDRTARSLAKALEAAKALDVPLIVKNVPGDGARKAWAYMDTRVGDAHVLSISHPNLTTDRLVGLAAFDHRSYTPIATLYTEYIAFAVRSDSSMRTAADLLERMRASASSLSVALSTALGNPNHIALARVVRHAGGDAKALPIRVFDSALDAIADVMSGKSEVAAVTAASATQALTAGQARVLAVSAPQRLAGPFSAVPTWSEYSVDCIVGAWRGIAGAAGIGQSQITFWERALQAATDTATWRGELERHSWAACYIQGEQLRRFLEEERAEMAASLSELGLLRLDAPYSGRKTTERNA